MDIINVTDNNGNVITPHPDYIDYYTILLLKNERYINIFNKKRKYKNVSQVTNNQEHYGEDLILEVSCLLDYVDTEYSKISDRECELVESTIEKTKSLKLKYGYKTANNK
jgi:hypothetical protein